MTPEAFFIDYLKTALLPPPIGSTQPPGISVSGSVPHPMPDEFVTVELTGASRIDQIDHVKITVECWSTSRAAANALYTTVDDAMRASVQSEAVSRCELETGYNDTDTETHRPRYHARYGIVYLGGN